MHENDSGRVFFGLFLAYFWPKTQWKRPRTAIVLIVAMLAATLSAARSADEVDDRGVAVRLAAPPQRIVSLLPSLTESVCALGACERLVGVDRYSNAPERVRALPKVGGGLDASPEAVLALRPDLVLAATSARGIERLEALGLKVLALEPRTHEDVRRVLRVLGVALGTGGAQAGEDAWRRIDPAVGAIARGLAPGARGLSVYVEVGPAPYGASESSFIGQTLARLGARNVLPGSLGPFPKLSPEFVVRADPDLIFIAEAEAARLPARPGWAGMRAVARGHVCALTPTQADALVRAGPRMEEGARLIAQCLTRFSAR